MSSAKCFSSGERNGEVENGLYTVIAEENFENLTDSKSFVFH